MTEVLYITNIPSPYRVDFFNQLGEKVKLTVCFECVKAKNREQSWLNSQNMTYDTIVLNGVNYREDSSFSFDIINHINKHRNSVIILANYTSPSCIMAILYMKIKRIPFVITADGGFVKNDKWLVRKIKTNLMSAATYWIVSSKKTQEYECYYVAMKERVFIVPFTSQKKSDILDKPISTDYKYNLKKKLGIPTEKINLLFVGQIIERKGIDILNRIAEEISEDYCVMVAGGTRENYETTFNSQPNNKVSFLGFLGKEKLKEYYQAADIFIFPTREDIWGLVVNEAMSYGLPVITTEACIAGTELIRNGSNGYLVETENIEAYIHAINLLGSSRLREKIGKNALETIKDYTIENMVDIQSEYLIRIGDRNNGM